MIFKHETGFSKKKIWAKYLILGDDSQEKRIPKIALYTIFFALASLHEKFHSFAAPIGQLHDDDI